MSDKGSGSDSSDLDELAIAVKESSSPTLEKDLLPCHRCGFQGTSVWELARHMRRCKRKRRAEIERRLIDEKLVDLATCILMRQHLHAPQSECDQVVKTRYLLGGVEAVGQVLPGDGVVNCAEELQSTIRKDVYSLFCPAKDSDDFEIVPLFADSCAQFVKEYAKEGRILFHCAAGQSRSTSMS